MTSYSCCKKEEYIREKIKRKLLLKNGRKDRHDMSVNEHFSLSSWKKTISHLTREREREGFSSLYLIDRSMGYKDSRGALSPSGAQLY